MNFSIHTEINKYRGNNLEYLQIVQAPCMIMLLLVSNKFDYIVLNQTILSLIL